MSYGEYLMPFAGFDDWDDCMGTMMDEEAHDEESAQNLCGALQSEAKSDNGNVDQLREALKDGAGLVADVGVDLVSGVNEPAVNSKWTMLKSAEEGHDYRVDAPILLSKDESDEKRISYAAAMIPRQPDKEGDVVPTPTVEKAAHNFVKEGGGIDTDHSLIDGEGDPVESWVLKEERTFDLPGGGSETYPAGTWMLGVEWGADAWSRIKSGDLTGLSIYGMAEHVPLERSATDHCPHCQGDGVVKENPYLSDETREKLRTTKSENGATLTTDESDNGDMGSETTDGESNDDGGESPSVEELEASVESLTDTVESIKDAVETEETEKEDAREMAAELGDEYDIPAGDVLDILSAAAGADSDAVLEAIESVDADDGDDTVSASEKEEDGDDDDDDDDETEKDADGEANVEKGYSGEGTRNSQIESKQNGTSTSGGMPSYSAAAEAYQEED